MNFALILFSLVVATGLIWCFDVFWASKKRPADARDPWWVEYGGSFFPVILAVFLLRSFLVEPFKIPSGSMIPTLLIGDFILVNKYTYGVRLPVINKKIVELNTPQRGDVVVFRYPPDPTLDYIKRVVGLPGDKVVYHNKRLTINGQEVSQKKGEDYLDLDRLFYTPRFVETLGSIEHDILIEPEAPPFIRQVVRFPHADKCIYNSEGVSCEVPPGHYFMMGDNRDNSQDSRFWGFVPDENLVGKAFFIWFNFSDLKRIGSFH
ncbi:MAG: signal peptidase I [Burkholderiaceae bacterium]|nr:signal peptidase I [Sulfuritalea sp.]MCF8174551.1 signal peptidase I [Burkholderiaceae bacterium]